MSADRAGLLAHLGSAATSVCRCWAVVRRDGESYGFTDHDLDLSFDGMVFRAASGMTARAFQQTTGLAVDNSEAVGALSDVALSETDLAAGRFDGAEVRCWQVNWADPVQRMMLFCGHFGEVTRAAGSFRVELRGLADALNQPQGRVFQTGCSAVLGDARCGFLLNQPGYTEEVTLAGVSSEGVLRVEGVQALAAGWFERGRLELLDGPGAGLVATIRLDRVAAGGRLIELWQAPGVAPVAGQRVRLMAGCDRAAATCRSKFANFVNFRGFPHIPGEDWLTSYPVAGKVNDGGSRHG
ncbi:baseplate hub domain-containing protein [Tabrizicola fusiformis]|uniref:baseplate hub domain-containing protein n=1 Tax=Tabrizicola sp. SY72 TaxID=2741673 RepID=UPI0015740011|nr:DUF2163 domain-containing protein [Tabrizicola sp. SY72]